MATFFILTHGMMPYSAPTTSSSSVSLSSSVIKLREKLSSVSWVQCDKADCMKWRRVTKSVTDELTNDTWWDCSMNKDPHYNACHIEAEDTEAFDKLAKKAKLAVFKSELTPGALVWTKKTGYCHWPAIVTKDPDSTEFYDEDEDDRDRDYCHVEYLGRVHSHGWILARHIELFGHGNIDKANVTHKTRSKGQRRKRSKNALTYKPERRSYYGTVEKAIEEAKRLFPMSFQERLNCCIFTIVIPKSSQCQRLTVKKEIRKCPKFKKESDLKKNVCLKRQCDDLPKVLPRRSKRLFTDSSSLIVSEPVEVKNTWFNCEKDQEVCSSEKGCKLFVEDFATSVLDVTMEERLFLDIEIYKTNEVSFYNRLHQFYRQHGIMEMLQAPIWNEIQVNVFDFYLAVDEYGGYQKTTSDNKWSSICLEMTNSLGKGNVIKAKGFYHRYLYPFELYINNEDYSKAVVLLRKCHCKKRPSNQKLIKERNVTSQDEESEEDSEELINALDELDALLQTLNQKDRMVPDISSEVGVHSPYELPVISIYTDNAKRLKSPDWDAVTATHQGLANEPEESAQIVPEIDFPSISSYSEDIEDIDDLAEVPIYHGMEGHVIHELQAL